MAMDVSLARTMVAAKLNRLPGTSAFWSGAASSRPMMKGAEVRSAGRTHIQAEGRSWLSKLPAIPTVNGI